MIAFFAAEAHFAIVRLPNQPKRLAFRAEIVYCRENVVVVRFMRGVDRGAALVGLTANCSKLTENLHLFSPDDDGSRPDAKLFQHLAVKVGFAIKLFNLFYHPMRITTDTLVRVTGNRLVPKQSVSVSPLERKV